MWRLKLTKPDTLLFLNLDEADSNGATKTAFSFPTFAKALEFLSDACDALPSSTITIKYSEGGIDIDKT